MSQAGAVSAAPARWLRAAGALLAGAAVALAAYASHGAEGAARANLLMAALFGFGHGLALAALGRGATRLALAALTLLLAGTLLFSGALVSKYLFAGSSAPAPLGGGALVLGWLLYAASALRD